MAVKNIILDFGGVLLDIDYQLTEQAFLKLGCTNFKELYSQAFQTNLFNKYEVGEINEERFMSELKRISGIESLKADEIKNAWNAMLIKFTEKNYLMLKDLKKKYRLFLLSNTNETHIEAFEKLIEKICPVNEFENLFEKVYYSCRIHLRKPDEACFLYVMKDSELNPEETVFVDDSVQHVEGANAAGIPAYLLQKNNSTHSLMKELGFL